MQHITLKSWEHSWGTRLYLLTAELPKGVKEETALKQLAVRVLGWAAILLAFPV